MRATTNPRISLIPEIAILSFSIRAKKFLKTMPHQYYHPNLMITLNLTWSYEYEYWIILRLLLFKLLLAFVNSESIFTPNIVRSLQISLRV